ncbi:MAG: cytochrome c [Candidatus Bipolaricaulia bacterium]
MWIVLVVLVAVGGAAVWLTPERSPTESARPTSIESSSDVDSSEPRPLKLLMVELAQDMARVNDGIWHGDRTMIADGAQAIADHPEILPSQMETLKEKLGERFSGFVGLDQAVHDMAAELAQSAPKADMRAIVQSYGQLQQGCVSCHAGYRDEVREVLY